MWVKGSHPIQVASVQVPGLTRMREERRLVVGSDESESIQVAPRHIVTPSGDVLQLRGSRSRAKLVRGSGDVLASVASRSGRSWRESSHSLHWQIECSDSSAGVQHPLPSQTFAVSVDRWIERDSRLDAVRGSGTSLVSGVIRDAIGTEIMTVETTYSVRRIGSSMWPAGARMTGSFDGSCRTLSAVPIPAAGLALWLILRPDRSVPEEGEFIISGGSGG